MTSTYGVPRSKPMGEVFHEFWRVLLEFGRVLLELRSVMLEFRGVMLEFEVVMAQSGEVMLTLGLLTPDRIKKIALMESGRHDPLFDYSIRTLHHFFI